MTKMKRRKRLTQSTKDTTLYLSTTKKEERNVAEWKQQIEPSTVRTDIDFNKMPLLKCINSEMKQEFNSATINFINIKPISNFHYELRLMKYIIFTHSQTFLIFTQNRAHPIPTMFPSNYPSHFTVYSHSSLFPTITTKIHNKNSQHNTTKTHTFPAHKLQ